MLAEERPQKKQPKPQEQSKLVLNFDVCPKALAFALNCAPAKANGLGHAKQMIACSIILTQEVVLLSEPKNGQRKQGRP